MLLYGAEAWTLLSTDAAALRIFERKVLRKIFGPVRVGDDFRIRSNRELYELLNDIGVLISRKYSSSIMYENVYMNFLFFQHSGQTFVLCKIFFKCDNMASVFLFATI